MRQNYNSNSTNIRVDAAVIHDLWGDTTRHGTAPLLTAARARGGGGQGRPTLRPTWVLGCVAHLVARPRVCARTARCCVTSGTPLACGDRFGRISGPFPPAVTSRPLLSALTTAMECDLGLSCGVKSARRKDHEAVLRLDGPRGQAVRPAAARRRRRAGPRPLGRCAARAGRQGRQSTSRSQTNVRARCAHFQLHTLWA